jgi:hypothetical protein
MNRKHLAVLAVLSLAVYFLGNWGAVVTDPVESNYTETAKGDAGRGGLVFSAHLRELLV